MRLSKVVPLALVSAIVAVSGVPSATAAPAKLKRGTYKVSSTGGDKFKMIVASCGSSSCLSSAPSRGSENELHLNCKNTSGGGDAISDYQDYGPQKFNRRGKIRTSSKQTDDGDVKTYAFSWSLTAKGTLTGTGRLSVTFADGGTCDSGVVTFKGHK